MLLVFLPTICSFIFNGRKLQKFEIKKKILLTFDGYLKLYVSYISKWTFVGMKGNVLKEF